MVLLDNYLVKYIQEWPDETLPSMGHNSKEGVYIYMLDDNDRNNKLDPPDVDHDFFVDETVE